MKVFFFELLHLDFIPFSNAGVFIVKGKEDALGTRNLVVGESVYGEKRVSIENDDKEKVEYRIWNPFRSKLAASILGGLDDIHMKPGSKLLYLGAASGTTVSHCSDIVGPVSYCSNLFCDWNYCCQVNSTLIFTKILL